MYRLDITKRDGPYDGRWRIGKLRAAPACHRSPGCRADHEVVSGPPVDQGRRRRLLAMWSQRLYVDYALQRRATLHAMHSGTVLATDVCDADPYLLRAAKFHG